MLDSVAGLGKSDLVFPEGFCNVLFMMLFFSSVFPGRLTLMKDQIDIQGSHFSSVLMLKLKDHQLILFELDLWQFYGTVK